MLKIYQNKDDSKTDFLVFGKVQLDVLIWWVVIRCLYVSAYYDLMIPIDSCEALSAL